MEDNELLELLKEKGLFGTSVLGDGSIIPVIDVNEVLRGGR